MFQCQVVRSRSNSCLETWTARWQEESLCLSSSCCSLRFCFCYFGPSIGDACRTLRIAPPSPSENIPMWYEVKPLTHLRGCLNFTHQPDREHEGLMWCNSSSTHPPFMELVLKPMTAASLTRFIKPQVRNLWSLLFEISWGNKCCVHSAEPPETWSYESDWDVKLLSRAFLQHHIFRLLFLRFVPLTGSDDKICCVSDIKLSHVCHLSAEVTVVSHGELFWMWCRFLWFQYSCHVVNSRSWSPQTQLSLMSWFYYLTHWFLFSSCL